MDAVLMVDDRDSLAMIQGGHSRYSEARVEPPSESLGRSHVGSNILQLRRPLVAVWVILTSV